MRHLVDRDDRQSELSRYGEVLRAGRQQEGGHSSLVLHPEGHRGQGIAIVKDRLQLDVRLRLQLVRLLLGLGDLGLAGLVAGDLLVVVLALEVTAVVVLGVLVVHQVGVVAAAQFGFQFGRFHGRLVL